MNDLRTHARTDRTERGAVAVEAALVFAFLLVPLLVGVANLVRASLLG